MGGQQTQCTESLGRVYLEGIENGVRVRGDGWDEGKEREKRNSERKERGETEERRGEGEEEERP